VLTFDKFATMRDFRFNRGVPPTLLISTLIFILSCSTSSKEENGSSDQPSRNDLPDMEIIKLDGSRINAKELVGKTILFLFQTDCDHCQREAADMEKNLSAFTEYSLYFVTSNPPAQIERFANSYKLTGHKNVHFGRTSNESILKSFGPIDAPSVYIYSSDHRLVKSFNGEVSVVEILKYL
jgi:peroxiredoxin